MYKEWNSDFFYEIWGKRADVDTRKTRRVASALPAF